MMKNTKDAEEYFISLGFAEKAGKNDFDFENFPSKLGGKPVWLIPPEVKFVREDFFNCSICKKNLTFLLQLYCPLESNKLSYHRVIYLFFCIKCWANDSLNPGVAVKALRVQLPESSDFYSGNKLIKKELINNENESICKINSTINPLSQEFIIETDTELPEASKIYIKFYDKIDEKSLKSGKSMSVKEDDSDNDMDVEEDLQINVDKVEDENIKKMIKKYMEEEGMYYNENNPNVGFSEEDLETEVIGKLQKDIFKISEDLFYDLFTKVVTYDPKQVIRYCRDDVMPLWFNSVGMVTVKNLKCKNCKSDLIYEFQVMPNIFNLYKEIMNIDIGTIVIYTCKNSCYVENYFIEEYAFIQRTGEKVIDFEKGKKGKQITQPENYQEISNEELIKNLNKISVKGNENNEPDEDGWVEVKKKTKK